MTAACGTRTRYRIGCRCDQCRAANTQYYRDQVTARRLGITPTRLCACGCQLPVEGGDGRRLYISGHQPRWVAKPPQPPDPDMYALQLLEISEQIIGDVHDAGPAEVLAHLHRVRKLPCPAGVDPVAALVTVLAAQVDPDSTESQRLGWVEAIGERRRAG